MKLTDADAQSLLKWIYTRSHQAGLSAAEVSSAPAIPSVYMLVDPTGSQVYYVGQSNHLRRRLLAHTADPKKAEAGWQGDVKYLVPGVESTDLRLEIEAHLILLLRPPLNQALFLNVRGRRIVEIRWRRKGKKAVA